MKKLLHLPLIALFCGCVSSVPHDQLTVFAKGDTQINGTVPAYQLRSYGSWGAGELASGKADMIFDGIYYYRLSGSRATALTASEQLSSGWAVRFRPDRIDNLPANFRKAELDTHIANAVPDLSMSCVYRIVGHFNDVIIQSADGVQNRLHRIPGALYGMRTPKPLNNNVETSMWFLSSDYSYGGRVTDFTLSAGSLAVDLCPRNLFINIGLKYSEKTLK